MNQEVSILNSIKDVRLVPATSKSGNPYDRLVIDFYDGYQFRTPVLGDTGYILRKQNSQESEEYRE